MLFLRYGSLPHCLQVFHLNIILSEEPSLTFQYKMPTSYTLLTCFTFHTCVSVSLSLKWGDKCTYPTGLLLGLKEREALRWAPDLQEEPYQFLMFCLFCLWPAFFLPMRMTTPGGRGCVLFTTVSQCLESVYQ